jgi:hypothetical protein
MASWPTSASMCRNEPCRGCFTGDVVRVTRAPDLPDQSSGRGRVHGLLHGPPRVTGRVLFVLVLLSHRRRHIVHFNIAEHPTAWWAAQQVVEAFPDDTAPRWLLRDRDSIYGDAFGRRVAGMAIAEIVCSPASPWQNPYAERVIGYNSA